MYEYRRKHGQTECVCTSGYENTQNTGPINMCMSGRQKQKLKQAEKCIVQKNFVSVEEIHPDLTNLVLQCKYKFLFILDFVQRPNILRNYFHVH
jgi:hypothetical protein